MTSPLDEKGHDAGTQALLNAFPMADKIAAMYAEVAVRAYLSATPAPDGLEAVGWFIDADEHGVYQQVAPQHNGEPDLVALVRADQAQSALAARDAQVQRLTEENEALREALKPFADKYEECRPNEDDVRRGLALDLDKSPDDELAMIFPRLGHLRAARALSSTESNAT